jgi:hypothetical protein
MIKSTYLKDVISLDVAQHIFYTKGFFFKLVTQCTSVDHPKKLALMMSSFDKTIKTIDKLTKKCLNIKNVFKFGEISFRVR